MEQEVLAVESLGEGVEEGGVDGEASEDVSGDAVVVVLLRLQLHRWLRLSAHVARPSMHWWPGQCEGPVFCLNCPWRPGPLRTWSHLCMHAPPSLLPLVQTRNTLLFRLDIPSSPAFLLFIPCLPCCIIQRFLYVQIALWLLLAHIVVRIRVSFWVMVWIRCLLVLRGTP